MLILISVVCGAATDIVLVAAPHNWSLLVCPRNIHPNCKAVLVSIHLANHIVVMFSRTLSLHIPRLSFWSSLVRHKSSKAWLQRNKKDVFSRSAKVQNFPSRAVFKLAELHSKFKLFKSGMTVVDLGWAPGSWSKYAAQKTRPNGRVIGVDLLCLPPPEGVTTLQGNFLSQEVQLRLEDILANDNDGRSMPTLEMLKLMDEPFDETVELEGRNELEFELSEGNLEIEREYQAQAQARVSQPVREIRQPNVDLVLSDMCGSTGRNTGYWLNSINSPFFRLQNTSGILVRDHAASMDVCDAALVFAMRNLKEGGTFLCKFYTGEEDDLLELRLKRSFKRVHRVKPSASRKESREAYFVAEKFRGVPVSEIFKHTPQNLERIAYPKSKSPGAQSADAQSNEARSLESPVDCISTKQ